MPGIFGGYRSNHKENLDVLMERMADSLNDGDRLVTDRFIDNTSGLFMGRVSLGVFNAGSQPVKNEDESCFIFFHGELYGNQSALNDPEYLLKAYLELGDNCADDLNGIFHFAVFDKQKGLVKLFSDKFGLQPLYYALPAKDLVFGAEVKAVLQESSLDRTPDYRSFADFFHYGQILGEKTLFKHIQLLAPGSVLTFNLTDGSSGIRKYWDLKGLFAENGSYDMTLSPDKAVDLLVQSIQARSKNRENLGLSLSGGLDSRGILAGIGENAKGLKTYTLGLSGCADERLAGKMASFAGTDHDFVQLSQEYIANFEQMSREMIRLSDGMYHPHESTEMLALQYFAKSDFKILLRGHGGEIAKAALAYPVMVTPQLDSCSGGTDALRYIYQTTNLVLRDIDKKKLFNPEVYPIMNDAPFQSLEESCGNAGESLSPPDLCIYYYMNEHIRRQVVSSLDIFRSRIEIRMPYVDEAYIGALLKLPVKLRNRGEIHYRLVQRCMPGLLKIPDSNTGAPMDASPLRLLITDKFNSLMKRMSVKGFRHYTEFEKWHRDGFQESSRKIIFSERSAGRNLYNMDYLKQIFDLHTSGQKNYAHLLGTIVGLELWFRVFCKKPIN